MMIMCRKIGGWGIIFSFLFIACGPMDTLLSSYGGAYFIGAKVGQYTLDESSIIRANTPIRPYFVKSIDDDPDIRGLTIFLQSLNGQIIGKKITYTVEPNKKTAADVPDDETDITKTDDSASEETSSILGETESLPGSDADFTGESVIKDGNTSGSSSEVDPSGGTGSADSGFDDSVMEEDEFNDVVYYFRDRKTTAEQEEIQYDEEIIYVKTLNENLPPLYLPEDLAAGQYILVFQVLGEKDILNRVENSIYYIAKSEFILDDIHIYLPDVFDGSRVVPPDVPVMLESSITAGTGLNPYVIWYNGKSRIHEEYAVDGVSRFIWKTPSKTGFHALKVEAFPFKPQKTAMYTPIGSSKELSLPVSAKNEKKAVKIIPADLTAGFSGQELSPVRWYQFFANLEDSYDSANKKNTLAVTDHLPKWLPWGTIFGTAIGPNYNFSIPSPLFTLPVKDIIEGRMLFRFVPLAEGTIFSGSFTLKNSFETLDMKLSYAQEMVILNYSAGSAFYEDTIPLSTRQGESLITAIISFEIQKNLLWVRVDLNTPAKFMSGPGIHLPGLLTGDGTFQIGTASAFTQNGYTFVPIVPDTVVSDIVEYNTTTEIIPADETGTGKTETSYDQASTANTTIAGPSKESQPNVDKIDITAILDEIIILVTGDNSESNKPQVPAEDLQNTLTKTTSSTADMETTVKNEEPDTKVVQQSPQTSGKSSTPANSPTSGDTQTSSKSSAQDSRTINSVKTSETVLSSDEDGSPSPQEDETETAIETAFSVEALEDNPSRSVNIDKKFTTDESETTAPPLTSEVTYKADAAISF
jgi:hypothetical protein